MIDLVNKLLVGAGYRPINKAALLKKMRTKDRAFEKRVKERK